MADAVIVNKIKALIWVWSILITYQLCSSLLMHYLQSHSSVMFELILKGLAHRFLQCNDYLPLLESSFGRLVFSRDCQILGSSG